MHQSNYLVIMAGGVGTRFWPFSRQHFPKQFHDILGTGKTLIQQTAERYEGIVLPENIYVVTSREYFDITKDQLPYLSDDQILTEPSRRNTAPCIAYACYKIGKKDPNANIVVAPADHIILKEEEFRKRISIALETTATQDVLLTIGIQPTRPDTGYGYIQFEEDDSQEVKKVRTFTEKPNLELAKMFLESGDYLWNGGIFVWNINSIKKAFESYLPEIADAMATCQKYFYTPKEEEALANAYPRCKIISIDNGVMEKAQNVHVVHADIGWSDLGTWKSVYENSDKDDENNVLDGLIHIENSKNCVIKTPKDKLVFVEGLEGFIVAEFDGVLMLCPIDQEQKVKEFVAKAEAYGHKFV
ncbi:MAG: mannose-1-phosphate guanylyltransferase [Leadbetterella sp.]